MLGHGEKGNKATELQMSQINKTSSQKKNKDKDFIFVFTNNEDLHRKSSVQIYSDLRRCFEKIQSKSRVSISDGLSVYSREMLTVRTLVSIKVDYGDETTESSCLFTVQFITDQFEIQQNRYILTKWQRTLYRIQMLGLSGILLWIPGSTYWTLITVNFRQNKESVMKHILKEKWKKAWCSREAQEGGKRTLWYPI